MRSPRSSSSLTSPSGQRTRNHAIRGFVGWYCSEPRLAVNRTVVLGYRIYLEQRQYAPSTINLRLAAVRRVTYEAAAAGLLSPQLAAGIIRVQLNRNAFEEVLLGTDVLNVRRSQNLVLCAGLRVRRRERHQLLWFGERAWTQQDGVNNAEYRDVGADAQGHPDHAGAIRRASSGGTPFLIFVSVFIATWHWSLIV